MSDNSFQNPEEMIKPDDTNPNKRMPVALCLDTSGSMSRGNAIDALNIAVCRFFTELKQDERTQDSVETVAIEFGGSVNVVSPFDLVTDAVVPTLHAKGNTPMGEAIIKSLELLSARKTEYQTSGITYSQPILVLMTDGEPTDPDTVIKAESRIHELTSNKSLTVIPICFSEKSNIRKMKEITGEDPIIFTDTTEFTEFFLWLSSSCSVGAEITAEAFKKVQERY